jgi:hypothetical protein
MRRLSKDVGLEGHVRTPEIERAINEAVEICRGALVDLVLTDKFAVL